MLFYPLYLFIPPILKNKKTVFKQRPSETLFSDGQIREMGDVLLANDTLHSRYIDKVKLNEDQANTPNLQGIGRLRDLREAAALSPKLVLCF